MIDPQAGRSFDMTAIERALAATTPFERERDLALADGVAVGITAMRLATDYLAHGNLDAAHRWYTVAATHCADGAQDCLTNVAALRDAMPVDLPSDSPCALARMEFSGLAAGGRRRGQTFADVLDDLERRTRTRHVHDGTV
ncbi:hypothetical protein [Amycolatopsis sp. CA-230715]|uniref:hypothetical protein n=1 Tax=Amycolatopsis sp. CA-230715 TaxID=2745196 RepID=UPI001C035058|nr:hypothetical protein [Amycolatopsis sp. CA-230715]QWF85613.1 hypothetical protein HUW46_09068 [Amycolatopsis sp. CA-230715]